MCEGFCCAKVGISAKEVDGMAARGYEECKAYMSIGRVGEQSMRWFVESRRSTDLRQWIMYNTRQK